MASHIMLAVLLVLAVLMLAFITLVRFYPHYVMPRGQPFAAAAAATGGPAGAPSRAKIADLVGPRAAAVCRLNITQLPLGALHGMFNGGGAAAGSPGCLVLMGRDSCGYCQLQFGTLVAAEAATCDALGVLGKTPIYVAESSTLGGPDTTELVAQLEAATGGAGRGIGVPMWVLVRAGGGILRVATGWQQLDGLKGLAQEVLASKSAQ